MGLKRGPEPRRRICSKCWRGRDLTQYCERFRAYTPMFRTRFQLLAPRMAFGFYAGVTNIVVRIRHAVDEGKIERLHELLLQHSGNVTFRPRARENGRGKG